MSLGCHTNYCISNALSFQGVNEFLHEGRQRGEL